MYLNSSNKFKLIFPICLSYVFLGLLFGMLFAEKGGTPLEAFLISLLTFAGAAQYFALEHYHIDFSPLILFIAILILNLRHIIYGISLGKYLGDWSFKKVYLIHSFTDENFGLLSFIKDEKPDQKILFKIFLFNHLFWIVGCLLGAILADKTLLSIKGIDFFLVALFVILFIESLKKARRQHGF